jgi:hypothetical protein
MLEVIKVSDICSVCQKEIVREEGSYGIGYGLNKNKEKVCYQCCAEEDKKQMRETGKAVLYLIKNKEGTWEVTNWPGTLRFKAGYIKESRHNIARIRRDTWIVFEGYYWHCIQYGDNSELCYCKKTKEVVK